MLNSITQNKVISFNAFKSEKANRCESTVQRDYFSKLDFSALINETNSLVAEINNDDVINNDLLIKVDQLTAEFKSRILDNESPIDKYLLATIKDLKYSIKAKL
ncbi:hypothetical protein ACRXCV_13670 [Halobacteriovorax sp. GFR7]|uniref:hypothetical protein n=1 Tax=unclassified Halobacteriovorax TaxID=2639665 RepID=UPI003719A620